MLACGIVAMGFGMAFSRCSTRAAMGLGANLRDAEFEAIQRYSYENLDHFDTSSLVTRMTTDVTVIQNALMNGFRPMMRGPVMFTAGLILASLLSVRLACVFFVMLPLLAVALALIVRHVAPLYRVLQGVMDELNDVVQESVTAIRAVKAFVRGEWVEQRFGAVNGRLADTSTRTFGGAVLNLPLFQTVMYSSDVLILALGGSMIMAGQLKVGELTGFMSYVLQITNSLMMISNVFLLMTRALTSVQRVGEVLAERPTMRAPRRQSPRFRTARSPSTMRASGTTPMPRRTSCMTSRYRFRRAPRSASSAARARARARSCSCWAGSTTSRRAPCSWAATTCAAMTSRRCAVRWA